MTTLAIVLAGGSGTRMDAGINKAFLPLGDRLMISWSLRTFQTSPLIGSIVVVAGSQDLDRARELVRVERVSKVCAVVAGGATRHASEHAGLEASAKAIEQETFSVVCVHDAARPFFTKELLHRVVEGAERHLSAVPCLPFSEPLLLRADPSGGAAQPVQATQLRRSQTPQAFDARALLEAHRQAARSGLDTLDTAECWRLSGAVATVVRGDERNIKVTYPDDLDVARAMAASSTPSPS